MYILGLILTAIISSFLTLVLHCCLIIAKENIEKLKIIIYALKELFVSSKKQLITKVKREEVLFLYDNCKSKQAEYENTNKEIHNLFEYYYISMIRELEKS